MNVRKGLKTVLIAAVVGVSVGALLGAGIPALKKFGRADLGDELDKMPAYRDMYAEAVDTCAGDCQFDRKSAQTLVLSGRIRAKTYEAFMRNVDGRVTEIVVNSVGGGVEPALKIAEEIERRGLRVVVQGYCLSSCANYLFLAGREKAIRGILGYHGGVQALHRELVASGKNPPCGVCATEKAFFARVGVSEKLFDITQSRNKGFTRGVSMYVPSAATLRALGVRNIVGDQNEQLLRLSSNLYERTQEGFFAFGRDPNPEIMELLNRR